MDELTKARLEQRHQQLAGEFGEKSERRELEISRLRKEQRQLFDRRQNGEVIPDHIYNEEMNRLGDQCREHERARDKSNAQVGLQSGAIAHLERELDDDPLEAERWLELSPERRNEFLRLFFPYGVTVMKKPSGKNRKVDHRLRPRTCEEAEAAERLRLGGART
jgi:hypothetical protein